MENASISVLIAGSVLIVILIIALALIASTRASQVTDTAQNQFDQMSVNMHNNQFKKCEGTNLSYKEVKDIIAQITQNNYNVSKKSNGYKILLTVSYYSSEANASARNFIAGGNGNFDQTFFIDNVNTATTKSPYLKDTKYTSKTYDCFAITDTQNAIKGKALSQTLSAYCKEHKVVTDGSGVVNEIIIVARAYD